MPPGPPPGFSKNVFINCPFDSEYDSLLRPILFTIIYLGYNPQIASQTSDSGEQRITKILSLILKSKFSIHDLSRIKSAKPGEFFRLNMPFELGIDYGCRRIGGEHLRRKRFLVLGEKPHDYKKALSDLGGVDAKPHANQPNKAVLSKPGSGLRFCDSKALAPRSFNNTTVPSDRESQIASLTPVSISQFGDSVLH